MIWLWFLHSSSHTVMILYYTVHNVPYRTVLILLYDIDITPHAIWFSLILPDSPCFSGRLFFRSDFCSGKSTHFFGIKGDIQWQRVQWQRVFTWGLLNGIISDAVAKKIKMHLFDNLSFFFKIPAREYLFSFHFLFTST